MTDVFYGIDLDPKILLADLFERIIERYNADDTSYRHTDNYVWSKVYKSYFDKYGITKELKKHTVKTKKDTINFDKAWKNGVWNCYQALSLDLKTEDSIKSKVYKWSGILRELETAKEQIHLYFLTSTPKEHQELSSFIKETLVITDDNLKVDIVAEDKAEDFAAHVREQMKKSDII